MGISRRRFLELAGLTAAGLTTTKLPAWATDGPYPIELAGENFAFGHLIRDGHAFTCPKPSKQVDVVVVGGGMGGLRAAYGLRHENLLVLEKEDRVGGHARSGEWAGITYAEGAAYIPIVDDHLKAFFREIGYAPKQIPSPVILLLDKGVLAPEPFGAGVRQTPFDEKVRKQFLRFISDLKNTEVYPVIPFEKLAPDALRLDRISMADFLKPYGDDLVRLMDIYCRSALGGTVHEVSALGGLYFYSGELGPRYTLPGGMAPLAMAMRRHIDAAGPGRILTDAKVLRIEPRSDSVWVTYLLGNTLLTVEAKSVVVGGNKQFAKHIIKGLPEAQFAAISQMQYEPYLISNVLIKGVPYRRGYDTWMPGASFSDVVVADWVEGDVTRQESVLTIYHPLPRAQRHQLLDDAGVKAMVRRDVAYLDKHVPGLEKQVHAVRSYRRGHGIVCSAVNAVSTLLEPIKKPVGGRVFFSNSDGQLSGCVESAMYEGERAAAQAKSVFAKKRQGLPL